MARPSRTLSSADWEQAERGNGASPTLNLSMLQVSSLPPHFFFFFSNQVLDTPSSAFPHRLFPLCCPALTSGTYVILAHGHRYGFYHQKWLLILSSFPTLFTCLCLTLFTPGSHLALDLSQDRVIIAGKTQHAGTPGWCSDVKRPRQDGAGLDDRTASAVPLSFTASSAFSRANTKRPLVGTPWAWRISSLISF